MSDDLDVRKEIARELLSSGITETDLDLEPPSVGAPSPELKDLGFTFPAGLRPIARPIDPAPAPGTALPEADVVIVTWTVDEVRALSDVFTPGFSRDAWYRYDRKY